MGLSEEITFIGVIPMESSGCRAKTNIPSRRNLMLGGTTKTPESGGEAVVASSRNRTSRNVHDIRQRTHAKTFPTATGGIARLAYTEAKKAGLDVEPLLKNAELTAEQVADDHIRVPVIGQVKFLNLVADALQNDCLGIRLAQKFDFREAGLVYYVMASSGSLGEALTRVARYSGISNESIRAGYHEDRSTIAITFHYVGISRLSDRHQI